MIFQIFVFFLFLGFVFHKNVLQYIALSMTIIILYYKIKLFIRLPKNHFSFIIQKIFIDFGSDLGSSYLYRWSRYRDDGFHRSYFNQLISGCEKKWNL